MASSIEAMLRGLSGGKQGGLGRINYMKPVGAMTGGGVRASAGAAPQVRAPGSSDLMVNPNSALSAGDEWLKGHLKEWMPTPQEQQAKKNANLLSQVLVGDDNQQGLIAQTITPELLQKASGTMRAGGADAEGMLNFAQWAAPAMQSQKELEWKMRKADVDEEYRRALIAKVLAQTANTQAAGARAAAKGTGGGSGGKAAEPDDLF